MRVSELANELGKTSKEVLDIIKQKLQENQKVVVLAKGSRSMKMEETIYSLKDSLC